MQCDVEIEITVPVTGHSGSYAVGMCTLGARGFSYPVSGLGYFRVRLSLCSATETSYHRAARKTSDTQGRVFAAWVSKFFTLF